MAKKQTGWQQSPVRPPRVRSACPHIGATFAALSLSVHPEGHEWVCACGTIFVVVSNGGMDKKLVEKGK